VGSSTSKGIRRIMASLRGFGVGEEYEYECNQDFECGWRWGSANSTAGFDGIVYLGAAGRRRSLPLGWLMMLNRGARDFADKISMGESTLGWNTDKSGGLASLQYSLHTGRSPNDSPDGLRLPYTASNRQQHPTRTRCLYLGQLSENIQVLKRRQVHRSGESDHVTHAVG
jgi:hypothetical protein